SKELQQLKNKYSALTIIEVDVTDDSAPQKILSALKDCKHIDILINNAGVYEDGNSKAAFMKSFEINSFVPLMMTETLLPKLKASATPKVVHITSLMGSIADNTSGGSYAYRSSKTALNMIHKCLSLEHDWLMSLAIHPGWVQTSMGGESAPLSPETSSQGIWKVIEGLTNSESGSFKDYQGRKLPW
ncbi:MAG: SDR family oxidoreductase, partial [Bdellovibrionales bacterium]|nr:SDR family oxidoreductase [Bdellovibrionales bacterium]